MPRVSVVVLNRDGGDLVLQSLRSALAQEWADLEVLVVDNASNDGSPDRIAQEFGDQVRLIRRRVNSPTAGRNEGFRAASGEYILSLDNDIILPSTHNIRNAVAAMEQCPLVGVLAFKICSPDRPNQPLPEHWWHPISLERGKDSCFYTDFFGEGAVFLRTAAIAASGGYDDDFFHGFESGDLALRILQQDFDILYCPDLTCFEMRIRGWHHLAPARINYLTLRNKLWTVWKNYPLGRGLYFAATRIAMGGLRATRYGWAKLWGRAIVEGIAAPGIIRKKRCPLSSTTWNRIDQIRKGRFCARLDVDDVSVPVVTSTVAGEHV